MLLALDLGNTNAHATLFAGEVVAASLTFPTADAAHTGERIARWCGQLGGPVTQVVVAGVVPPAVAAAERSLVAHGWPVAVLARDFAAPMTVRYEPPTSLGADRLLAALAARELCGAPVLVADCGTATTLDVVAPDGAFAGGAILCGLGLQRAALHHQTALLPEVPLVAPPRAIGNSTVSCLQSGLVLAHAGAVAGLAARMRAECGCPDAPLVGTGSLAAVLRDADPRLFDRLEPDLTTTGLRLAWAAASEVTR